MKTLSYVHYVPTAIRSLFAAAAMSIATASALADPFTSLWYAGDPNTGDWGNQGGGGLTYYQGFSVTDSAGWTITDVYTIGNYYGGSVEWQIRTGMGGANPGTIVASGTSVASISSYMSHAVISVNVGSLFLAQGNYWLEVAGGAVSTTNGANGHGTTLSTIRNWPLYGQYYYDMSYYGATSAGVVGTVGTVPDSGALLSLVLGLASLAVMKVRRFGHR